MFNPFSINRSSKAFSYRCACCGKRHKGSPTFAASRPFICNGLSKAEFEDRVYLTADLCTIDDVDYFIRANLTIPIIGCNDGFVFDAWVTQSIESFKAYTNSMGQDQSDQFSFGRWPVSAAPYAESGKPIMLLKSRVVWQKKGFRPKVILNSDEPHQLGIDQRNGISWDRAAEMATQLLHPEKM